MSFRAITAEQFTRNNAVYANKFPKWTTSLNQCPMMSFCQMEFSPNELKTGYLQVRRPCVRATAIALAELLTYEAVERMIQKGKITPALAREWGAILKYGGEEVPFNLIAFGLEGADADPEVAPVPGTDRLTLLGLMLPTDEAVQHFKLWYEDGGAHLNFERDLIMPLLTYWGWYRKEYPNVRGIEFGRKSICSGVAASLEVPYQRKVPEPEPDDYEDYPFLDINEIEEEEIEADAEEEQEPAAVGTSPSGAKIY
jgi:hypothetical protein